MVSDALIGIDEQDLAYCAILGILKQTRTNEIVHSAYIKVLGLISSADRPLRVWCL